MSMSGTQTASPVAADVATDPASPAVTSPATDTSQASVSVATDTTAAAAAGAAQAAATPTPSSPTNTAAAFAASIVSTLTNIMGDTNADDTTIIEACKVAGELIENSAFTALLTTADQQAAASDT